ncbi:MAG: FIST C-terminal domain-containing protein [Candidatus Aegiribacteria sp.]|nr:FIST C-terminal domain-containing protein [Candidatus Aegiribacteria sp.]
MALDRNSDRIITKASRKAGENMFLAEVSKDNIVKAVSGLDVKDSEVVMILIGEDSIPDIEGLICDLNEKRIHFFGGIFPGVIHGESKSTKGAIIRTMPGIKKPAVVSIKEPDCIKIPDFTESLNLKSDKKYTAIILIDGMAPNIGLFLSEMLNKFGNSVNYFGGGAGYKSMKKDLCLFSSDGFFNNAAIVVLVKLEGSPGARHGWKKMMGPLVATRTDRNLISEFNWEKAFEVYREAVERDSGRKFSECDFYDIAKEYPLGLFREGCENIGRATVALTADGDIVCGGEVQGNAVVDILGGSKNSLIKAAQMAAEDCRAPSGRKICHCLVFDCISRALLLANEYSEELKAINRGVQHADNGEILEGALTLGEISSLGERYLEYLNLTTVVMVLYE